MMYFLALLPATMLTVAGYFVMYLSNRSEGSFKSFGKYLSFWAFTLAALVVLGAIFAAGRGGPHGMMMRMHGHECAEMHGMYPGHMLQPGGCACEAGPPPAEPPPPAAANVAPAPAR